MQFLSPERLGILLNSIPGVVWEATGHPDNPAQTTNYVSEGVERMLGYTVAEWLATPNFWLTIVHPDDKRQAAENAQRFFSSCRGGVDRFRWLTKDGRAIWVEAHSTVVCDAAGKPLGMRGVTFDITDRVVAEQELRDNQERLNGIIASAMDAVITVDEHQNVTVFNQAAERMFRVSRADALGKPLSTFVPAEYRAQHERHVANFGKTGVTSRSMSRPGTLQGLRADGSVFPIEAMISHVETSRGKLFTAIIRDKTEDVRRQEAQHYLAEAGKILASSLDYGTTLDNLARLTVPAFADWFSVDLLAPDGQHLEMVSVKHRDPAKVELAHELRRRFPPDLRAPEAADHPILTGRVQFYPDISDELLVASIPDQELLAIMRGLGLRSSISVPLRTHETVFGAITFIMGESGRRFDELDVQTARELGARAALAIENANLYRNARKAVRNREDILSIVSHDLRNPLSAVELSSAVLGRHFPEAASSKPLQNIRRAAKRALALIDDLDLVARIDTGDVALATERLALAPFIRELGDMFLPLAEDKGVSLFIDEQLGGAAVEADQKRLFQALSNLVSNALKFSPRGATVRVAAEAASDGAVIRVSDEGPGIPPEHREDIFKKNWQAEAAHHMGSGLGLYITKAVVEAHGGRIDLASPPGGGATFSVWLPHPKA